MHAIFIIPDIEAVSHIQALSLRLLKPKPR